MRRETRKSMIWAVILVLALLLSCLHVSAVFAASHTTVTIDGRALQLDVPPAIIGGRTLVPLRDIFEALGAEVEWDSDTRTVTGRKATTIIVLPIGSRYPTVNGAPVELDVPGTIVDGRTLVPARFIAESLGATVDWVQDTRTVVINSTGLIEVVQAVPTSPPVVEEKPPGAQDLQSRIESEPIVAYFGKSMDEIRTAFGTPTAEDYWRGAYFLLYEQEDLLFYFDLGENDKVHGLGFRNYQEPGQRLFLGWNRGITFDEIREKLGGPESESASEGRDDYDDIGGYQFSYSTEQYSLRIYGVDDTPGVVGYIEILTK